MVVSQRIGIWEEGDQNEASFFQCVERLQESTYERIMPVAEVA